MIVSVVVDCTMFHYCTETDESSLIAVYSRRLPVIPSVHGDLILELQQPKHIQQFRELLDSLDTQIILGMV
jgi:hypothetical protein